MMSYNNSIFDISASILSILVFRYIGFRSHFGGNHHVKLIANSENKSDTWFLIIR